MGSVIERHRFSRKTLALVAVFLMYLLGGVAFFYFGFQPAISAKDVYAEEAKNAETTLTIPDIGLSSPVSEVKLSGQELEVPEQIAGSYSVHTNKTLLLGHASTVFTDLKNLREGATITYDNKDYLVSTIEIKEKSSILMKEILKEEDRDTIVLMTCSGDHISGNDYSHRLIITALRK